jgi:hypothetical protein
MGMETVHLGFLLAEMNGLKVCAADISSVFLYSKTQECQYIIAIGCDDTALLDNGGAAIYQGLIGSANWATITLG